MSKLLSIQAAKTKLIQGNQRFINNQTKNHAFLPHLDKDKPFNQTPFAVILGCSDSRVPIEMIFDQVLGDLFIIRIAGNIVAPSQLGSIEFAITKFNTPLVVVLSHTHCGAIAETINECLHQTNLSKSIHSITDRIKPSVIPLIEQKLSLDELTNQVIIANAQNSITQIQQQSSIIHQAINHQEVAVIGAHYHLETGLVVFE